jgi:hypothetical protein
MYMNMVVFLTEGVYINPLESSGYYMYHLL